MQSAAEVPLVEGSILPRGQGVGADELAGQYQPWKHGLQSRFITLPPVMARYVPAGHCVAAVTPAGQKLPRGQTMLDKGLGQ
jgi:hypothetical protein